MKLEELQKTLGVDLQESVPLSIQVAHQTMIAPEKIVTSETIAVNTPTGVWLVFRDLRSGSCTSSFVEGSWSVKTDKGTQFVTTAAKAE